MAGDLMTHRYLLEVKGQSRWVDAQWLQGRLWIHLDGETFIVEDENKDFGQGAGAKVKADVISPMPGKVTKVTARTGDKIKVGDVLVVMEAMKMEYSLKAEMDGEIQKVDCKIGDQVALGKILVRIKADV